MLADKGRPGGRWNAPPRTQVSRWFGRNARTKASFGNLAGMRKWSRLSSDTLTDSSTWNATATRTPAGASPHRSAPGYAAALANSGNRHQDLPIGDAAIA